MPDDNTFIDVLGNAYWNTVTVDGVYTAVIPMFTHAPGSIARINPDESNIAFININDTGVFPISSEFPLSSDAYYDLIFDTANSQFVVNKTIFANVINSPNGLIVKATSTFVHRYIAGGVGVGKDDVLAYSSDGIVWTGLGKPATLTKVYCICWNGSMFVAAGDGTYKGAYSYDGINWVAITDSDFNTAAWVWEICWNGTMFVANCSTNKVVYSIDGITWDYASNNLSTGMGICWNGSIFVACGSGATNTISTSPDGINWTGRGKTVFSTVGGAVCWGNNMFVAVGGNGGANSIATSLDGIDWTGLGNLYLSYGLGICWNGTMFVAVGVGVNDTMAYSYNGTDWVGLGKTTFSNQGRHIHWSGTKFVATGNDGTNGIIATSPDGIEWTVVDNALFSEAWGITYTISPQLIPPQSNPIEYLQTANLQEWQDKDGNVKASVSPDGDISGRDLKLTRDLYYGTTKILSKMGNDSIFINGVIYGKMALAKGIYTGDATARTISTTFYPHFACCKSATAVQGIMWSILGGSKGSAVVNTIGNFMGVSDAGTGFNLGATAGCNTNAAAYKYFALAAHSGTLTGVKAKVGTYTGNATDNREITGIGFQPDIVIIKGAGAQYAHFRTSDHAGDASSYFLYPAADIANAIQALSADGFQIGTNAVVNTNAVVYQYIALKSDAAGAAEIAITKYNGMAGDGCKIWLPFQPNIVIALPGGALGCLLWTSAMTAGQTGYISSATANGTDGVIRAVSDGIYIGSGTEINTAQNTVNLVAIKCDL